MWGRAFVVAFGALAACGRGDQGTKGDVVTLDTADTPMTNQMALEVAGPLRSRVTNGHACFWFVGEDGSTISILWPHGSTAATDPLRVLDADGEVLATSGVRGLALTGAFVEDRPGCAGSESRLFAAGVVADR